MWGGRSRRRVSLRDEIAARLAAVRQVVAAAARRAGRDPASVRIVAVTQTLPPAPVEAALAAGLADIGGNYVPGARAQPAAVARRARPRGPSAPPPPPGRRGAAPPPSPLAAGAPGPSQDPPRG